MKSTAPRLGRGLASLLPEAPAKDSDRAVGSVETHLLEPNPFQPRSPVAEADLMELSASIQSHGILQPILARPHPERHGHYQIIAGERRWRAAQMAGLAAVPCFIRDMPDVDAGAAALIENLQRRDLNPIEEAEGYQKLVSRFQLTQEELGASVGKSRSHIANLLRLLNLPDSVKEHLRSGVLTAGHARAALAYTDPAAAADLMVARGLTVRQAEALASPSNIPRPKKTGATVLEQGSADIHAIEADLAEQLGLQVSITFNGHGGSILLKYQNLDQLDHIVARLGRSPSF